MKDVKENYREEATNSLKIKAESSTTNGSIGTAGHFPGMSIPLREFSYKSVQTLNLMVNGNKYAIQIEPNWPLRDVLRLKLGLTSIKDMCGGYGACGSCTVIMDGRPILSCSVLALECEGAVIETTEGIAAANHPLIEAYIRNWTAQCGYCTPGFLVTAKALLDRNPNPSVDEIKEALSGNICRCGTYATHIKAVLEAAKELRGEK